MHQVAIHHPNTVIAATAQGFHLSDDYGESFQRLSEPMPYYYQRACASFPESDIVLCTTSRGPHGQADALLFRSEDRGATWKPVSDLPREIAANLDTFQLVAEASGRAWLVVDNHNLWKSEDYGKSWSDQFNTTHRIDALLCL